MLKHSVAEIISFGQATMLTDAIEAELMEGYRTSSLPMAEKIDVAQIRRRASWSDEESSLAQKPSCGMNP